MNVLSCVHFVRKKINVRWYRYMYSVVICIPMSKYAIKYKNYCRFLVLITGYLEWKITVGHFHYF